jgi:uncharacterized membrane protein YfcA
MIVNFLIGIIAGVFGGLVGIGGGVLMIPLMAGIKKIGQHKAHGTSLVAVVFTGIIGAITYFFYNALDVWAAILISFAAVLIWTGSRYVKSPVSSCE